MRIRPRHVVRVPDHRSPCHSGVDFRRSAHTVPAPQPRDDPAGAAPRTHLHPQRPCRAHQSRHSAASMGSSMFSEPACLE
eukprot:scaffold16539_cov21-Phaeocystis_antarctica.AAC.1